MQPLTRVSAGGKTVRIEKFVQTDIPRYNSMAHPGVIYQQHSLLPSDLAS